MSEPPSKPIALWLMGAALVVLVIAHVQLRIELADIDFIRNRFSAIYIRN